VNAWFDRFVEALDGSAQLGAPPLTREEAALVLELAAQAARAAGARQFAPLAAYLAGRGLSGGDVDERLRGLQHACDAARRAGPAGEPLGLD